MASIADWVARLFVGGFTFGYLALVIFLAISFFVGPVAAFSAAWWEGIICLVLTPVAALNGIVYIGTRGAINLAAKLVALIVGTAAVSMFLLVA